MGSPRLPATATAGHRPARPRARSRLVRPGCWHPRPERPGRRHDGRTAQPAAPRRRPNSPARPPRTAISSLHLHERPRPSCRTAARRWGLRRRPPLDTQRCDRRVGSRRERLSVRTGAERGRGAPGAGHRAHEGHGRAVVRASSVRRVQNEGRTGHPGVAAVSRGRPGDGADTAETGEGMTEWAQPRVRRAEAWAGEGSRSAGAGLESRRRLGSRRRP
jgi:hypothetical protein